MNQLPSLSSQNILSCCENHLQPPPSIASTVLVTTSAQQSATKNDICTVVTHAKCATVKPTICAATTPALSLTPPYLLSADGNQYPRPTATATHFNGTLVPPLSFALPGGSYAIPSVPANSGPTTIYTTSLESMSIQAPSASGPICPWDFLRPNVKTATSQPKSFANLL